MALPPPPLQLQSPTNNPAPKPNHQALTAVTGLRLPLTRRRVFLRRRKLPVVRLGGTTKKSRRGVFLVRMFRKVRLRWLRLHYTCMIKKLKEYYLQMVKDIKDAGASLETFQQRILMEASFAVPVMGVSLSSFPSVAGSDRPRSLIYMY
ncbi:hypothetical protein Ddye_011836 [Dipteronia dyeriana]|uniref:Uncharacterized protein n=1 Tax=Dipteronia dyeriana TaxID=168575 RepID=A0AAD9X3B7_9ROSI|nr:hypothetical protein Ddye_011836 [Dipteronia dyeriana]